MDKSIFEYIGSYLQDGIQHRRLGEIPEKLKISIGNIDFNTKQKHVSITYNIELLDDSEIVSHYAFVSLFHIDNQEFEDSFLNSVNSGSKEFDDLCSNLLIGMIRFSFPFVRQMVHSMTNDIAGAILLPLIDASALLQQGLEFQRERNKTSPSISKKKKQK